MARLGRSFPARVLVGRGRTTAPPPSYAGTVAGLAFASLHGAAAGSYTAPAYIGTVDSLTFASQISTAAGTYTAPGAPAYNGTVDGLTFASALSTAAGSYVAPGDVPPSALPRYTITAKRRRLEIRA